MAKRELGHRYTQFERDIAISLCRLLGGAARAQAAMAGVFEFVPDERTIQRWAKADAESDEKLSPQDELMAEALRFKVLMRTCQDAIANRLRDDEFSGRELGILMGICTDKMLVMSGQATERTETRHEHSGDVTIETIHQLPDVELDRLFRGVMARAGSAVDPVGQGDYRGEDAAGVQGEDPPVEICDDLPSE